MCGNCGFICRETVRDWLSGSVLMWADVKKSSQCDANVLLDIKAKRVSCPCTADH